MTSGVNEKLYTGDINYIPSVNTTEWQVPVDGIKVDGKSIDVQAGLDTKPTAKFWLSGLHVHARIAGQPYNGPDLRLKLRGD